MPGDLPAFLDSALRRLDLLLHREILRLRAGYELSLDEFRGLYISDEQVDRLVDQALRGRGAGEGTAELTARAAALRAEAAARGGDSPLARLAGEFGLTPCEADVLLLAMAPEIDLKYETLYAYLNNDIGRKWPTRDLALRLFADGGEERWTLRRSLLPESVLFASGLLREVEAAPDHASTLAAGFTAAPLAVRFALGLPLGTHGLGAAVRPVPDPGADPPSLSPARVEELRRVARLWAEAPELPVLAFEGERDAGRSDAAAWVCRELGVPLLRVDPDAARAAPDGHPGLLRTLALRQRLEPAGLYVPAAEAPPEPDGRAAAEVRALAAALHGGGGPLILAGPPGTAWRELLGERRCVVLRFEAPDREERRRLWAAYLQPHGGATPETVGALADRFRLAPGQIRRAVAAAVDQRGVESGEGRLTPEALFRAAREESGHPLDRLATRVETVHGWGDLVLPPASMRRVRELVAAVQHRYTVYTTWGFDRRVGPGQGLRALFAGGSGTGKTMTAGVIARELGLELYKVDLSGVVSKYIGETEKNLDRIFRAAHAGNAVLFFDEADALFGRRSEVKDAHDRYANIEVAYLLQRVEEHEGIVILATNLRKNIDEAFARRMHYVVEFPLPDDTHREQLWRGMFPTGIPLDGAVDFRFLAKQFALSGGDIRNVALEAAFLAAQDGRVVNMRHLVNAVARQMLKQGKIPSATDFRQYHALLAAD
ncbi:MAG TPA: ATP-binding protein [Longimicrobiaceae bacterium]|nr:ATP-binding protein [Longimicrobiaceae bacterium]